ncbi:EscU/YscU/HrcU family type III secretion system export apparatus switch protein [Thermoanaerobacterium sp. DL9XJH110]|uniref:EscU/YscU/HrcU family type III secretion system export apparatus switch protein n=1 Tax=Thermoanaerobacterium sp. DL9XJH110 TaxID=3386643 RepID=UPI003BB51426
MPETFSRKNKIKKAAALEYDAARDTAPRLVASGKGLIAEKILELARKHNIALHRDPELVEALVQVEIGQEIPPELYQAVAEILAFIYSLDK